ncbi:MAG: DUF4097 family beta strand repeat protein [Solobacterium sp.]|nr:DUF4097 family beta strand repeat protein [Solobacterium sp.]
MTRFEYLYTLEKALASYPEDFKKDILETFELHFKEGLANGLSEEEIIQSLGTVEEVMSNIRMMNGDFEDKEIWNKEINLNLTDIAHSIKSTMIDVSSFINKTIKDFPTDIFQSPEAFTEENDLSYEDINTLIFEGNCDISLMPSTKLHYIFRTYKADDSSTFHIQKDGNTLFIKTAHKGYLQLTIPETIQNISLTNSSSDYSIKNCQLEKLNLFTGSGDIEIESSHILHCIANSKSGNIHVKALASTDTRLQSLSGDVAIYESSGNIHAQSVSGDVEVHKQNAQEATLISVSGDVELRARVTKAYCKSVSGDIDLSLVGEFEECEAESISGDIDCYTSIHTLQAELSTIGGDIFNNSGLAEERIGSKTIRIGQEGPQIKIHSKSGDISLH